MFPYCRYVRLLIWDKLVSYNGYTWRHQHELIAWGERVETKRIETGDGDIIRCRGILQENRNHPAEKPIEVIRKLIVKHKSSADNLVILDPYIGSGSTAIVCKQLGINFIGFELEKDFYDIALNRLLDDKKQNRLGI
jgi:DNA modification methylase